MLHGDKHSKEKEELQTEAQIKILTGINPKQKSVERRKSTKFSYSLLYPIHSFVNLLEIGILSEL